MSAEVKNCLTCRFEPDWCVCKGGPIGKCKYPLPPYTLMRHAWIRKGMLYLGDRPMDCCPVHQPKEDAADMAVATEEAECATLRQQLACVTAERDVLAAFLSENGPGTGAYCPDDIDACPNLEGDGVMCVNHADKEQRIACWLLWARQQRQGHE